MADAPLPSPRARALAAFARLLDVMDRLRAECPWDREQTFESLRILTIEEVYELADAIVRGDRGDIAEEIGDVTLHMVFYALLGSEEGAFDIASVLDAQCEKLIRRHPHIYGEATADDEDAVKRNWQAIKLTEGRGGGPKTVLGGVPRGLPALAKAYRMQEKTAHYGFEWSHAGEVLAKVREELDELTEAVEGEQGAARVEEEFGDLLFALVNYGRFVGAEPELALERANQKFRRRFEYVEANAPAPLTETSLAEMDALWEACKRAERAERADAS